MEFAPGTAYPDGYIAPATSDPSRKIPGWTRVTLSPLDYPDLKWTQWVRDSAIVDAAEVVGPYTDAGG